MLWRVAAATPPRRETMDGSQFDDLIRSLTSSRRALVGGVFVTAAGWLGATGTGAKKRRRHKKKKKLQLNGFGCVDVGGNCFGNSAKCCSGICEGSGKTSRCVAHNELGCDADDETCSELVLCGTQGTCYRTTGKAAFCGNVNTCDCGTCHKDSDCEAQFGPGAACVVCSGDCAGVNGSQGTACVSASA
jgi:hypothetical protein